MALLLIHVYIVVGHTKKDASVCAIIADIVYMVVGFTKEGGVSMCHYH